VVIHDRTFKAPASRPGPWCIGPVRVSRCAPLTAVASADGKGSTQPRRLPLRQIGLFTGTIGIRAVTGAIVNVRRYAAR
jgi:hypothetical protein